jgi:hypothetical protein
MKLLAAILVSAFLWPTSFAAQATPAKATTAKPAPANPAAPSTQKLPPFSGTWLLNMKRSQIYGTRPSGKNFAVIQYDGKTWKHTHVQWNGWDQQEDAWQVVMVVGSPVYHVEQHEPLTFRSRIYRQGDSMVMLEYIRSNKGQNVTTTIHYTLEDDGNTLIEEEKSKGPLGVQTSHWVLERQTEGINYSLDDDEKK